MPYLKVNSTVGNQELTCSRNKVKQEYKRGSHSLKRFYFRGLLQESLMNNKIFIVRGNCSLLYRPEAASAIERKVFSLKDHKSPASDSARVQLEYR